MVASPRLCRWTTPSRSTRTTRLDGSKTDRPVTSRVRPSEKAAVTRRRTSSAGSVSTACRGVTSSRCSTGLPGGSSGQPAAIQRRRMPYSREPTSKRLPPSWATAAVGLRRMRLSSGRSRSVRRANWSRVRTARSKSGSWPRRESLKPFLPFWLPWQAPALHPAHDSTAMTSLRKLTGPSAHAAGARTVSAARQAKQRTAGCMRSLAAGWVEVHPFYAGPAAGATIPPRHRRTGELMDRVRSPGLEYGRRRGTMLGVTQPCGVRHPCVGSLRRA